MAAFTELRNSLVGQLSLAPVSLPGEAQFYRGRLVRESLAVPRVTWGSTATPSPAQDPATTPAWLTATEFSDPEASLAVKISALQDLLVSSRRTLVYAGAGASTSAGLRQWARGGLVDLGDHRTTEAAPSLTHLSLASLVKVRLLPSLPADDVPALGWAGPPHCLPQP